MRSTGPLTSAVAGIWVASKLYLRVWEGPLYRALLNKWYVDELYDLLFVKGLAKGGGSLLARFDLAVLDGGVNGAGWFTRFSARASGLWDKWVVDLAVNATAKITYWSSFIFRAVQTGLWQNYALVFAIGLFLILLLFMYPSIPTTIKSFRRP